MPTIRIPPGVVRGESRAMIPERWYETNLIRWQQGNMKPIGGWDRIISSPLPTIMRNAHVWLDANGAKFRAYIGDSKVYYEKDGIYTNITPVGFLDVNFAAARGYGSGNYGTLDYGMDDEDRGSGFGADDPNRPVKFNIDSWNTELLFGSSVDGRIWVWNPATPATPPAVAVDAPTFVQSFCVTDEHHLMTFGTQGYPNRVAWSDQENRTGWNFASVTGQAGFRDLEGSGNIITHAKVPGGILIFTTSAVWLARYIGAPYFYGFTRIADGCTPISAHAVAVAGARAFWMGRNSFWKYEGGLVMPLQNSLGLEPFENLFHDAARRRVTAGFNGSYPEVWFFYPENQGSAPVQTENNRYVIHNFDEGWWADGWMHRSFYVSSALDQYPIAGSTEGYLFEHEKGYLAEGQPRGNMVYAEIGNLSFDDGEHNWQINQCQIDSPLGPDSVRFSFKGKRSRGGPEVVLQENVTPRADGYLDLHFTAKDFSMRIEGNSDGPWALGAMNFNDVKKRGKV